jgi:hypothetical protein
MSIIRDAYLIGFTLERSHSAKKFAYVAATSLPGSLDRVLTGHTPTIELGTKAKGTEQGFTPSDRAGICSCPKHRVSIEINEVALRSPLDQRPNPTWDSCLTVRCAGCIARDHHPLETSGCSSL